MSAFYHTYLCLAPGQYIQSAAFALPIFNKNDLKYPRPLLLVAIVPMAKLYQLALLSTVTFEIFLIVGITMKHIVLSKIF